MPNSLPVHVCSLLQDPVSNHALIFVFFLVEGVRLATRNHIRARLRQRHPSFTKSRHAMPSHQRVSLARCSYTIAAIQLVLISYFRGEFMQQSMMHKVMLGATSITFFPLPLYVPRRAAHTQTCARAS